MKFDESKRTPFDAPLKKQDTEFQTAGCRHTNPDICKNAFLSKKCAFSSDTGICLTPSRSWKKQFKMLQRGEES